MSLVPCLFCICLARNDFKICFLQYEHSTRLCFAAMCSSSNCCVSKLSTHFRSLHLNSFALCISLMCRSRPLNVRKCNSHVSHLNVKECKMWSDMYSNLLHWMRLYYWNVPDSFGRLFCFILLVLFAVPFGSSLGIDSVKSVWTLSNSSFHSNSAGWNCKLPWVFRCYRFLLGCSFSFRFRFCRNIGFLLIFSIDNNFNVW